VHRRLLIWAWLVCLPILTAGRVQVWQSDFSLWKDAVAKAPYKPRPWINYGKELAERQQTAAAFHAFTRAEQLIDARPNQRSALLHTLARRNLGILLQAQIDQGGCTPDQQRGGWQCRGLP
jgi:hypothetical protein